MADEAFDKMLREPAAATADVPLDAFRLLVQSVNNFAIFLLDPQGRIISWNEGAERIKGYRPQEIIGQHFSVFYPPEEVQAGIPQQELEQATAHGRVELAGWRRRKDGSLFWADITITALFDRNGTLRGFGKITRDATERRSSDQSLHKSRTMLERLFEHAPDAIVVIDSTGTIRKANLQAEAIFGYLREELVGRKVESLMPERFRQIHQQHRTRYFGDPRIRKMGVGLELYGLTRDSRELPVDIMLSPIETEEGVWASAVIRDITDRRQSEQAINELNDLLKKQVGQLAASNRELEAFSYSVSHDLRAPLRGLDGISLALLEDYGTALDPTAQDYLLRIRSAAQTMGELIDHLLTLSRLTRSEMRVEEVNLSELADKIVRELRDQNPGRSVQVHIQPDMKDTGDINLLRVAITNLLGNAWKFSSKKQDPLIEFGSIAGNEGERIYFVRDNGAGFNQDYRDNLFKPFLRLHGTGEFPGTGIGLATVQRVISRHNGRIWAEGEPERGATFYFTLGLS